MTGKKFIIGLVVTIGLALTPVPALATAATLSIHGPQTSAWMSDGIHSAAFQRGHRLFLVDTRTDRVSEVRAPLPTGCDGLDVRAGTLLVGCDITSSEVPARLFTVTLTGRLTAVAAWDHTGPVVGFGTQWLESEAACASPSGCHAVDLNWHTGTQIALSSPDGGAGLAAREQSPDGGAGLDATGLPEPGVTATPYGIAGDDLLAYAGRDAVYDNAGAEAGALGLTVRTPTATVLLDSADANYGPGTVTLTTDAVTWATTGQAHSYVLATGRRLSLSVPAGTGVAATDDAVLLTEPGVSGEDLSLVPLS